MAQLPNLSALRAFEAAARHESFTKAAEELGLTQAAISRHVKNLEESIGLTLFDRAHKSVSLTPAGARYAERVTRGFQTIAGFELPSHQGAKRVVLDVDVDLLRQWLMPRLSDERLRELDVHLVLRERLDQPKLFPADTDIALTWGSSEHEGFRSRLFLEPRIVLVAAPTLRIKDVDDMGSHRMLHDRDETWWRAVFSEAGKSYPDTAPALTFDRSDLTVEAAKQGLGVAVGDDIIAEKYLISGELVAAGMPGLRSRDFHIQMRKPRLPVKAKEVADWLMDEAALFAEWQKQWWTEHRAAY